LLGLGVLTLGLTACAGFAQKNAEVYRHLAHGNPQLALQALEKAGYGNYRDKILYELDKGMLLRLTGDYAGSNELFESAKQKMQRLSATSVTENLAAVTINETGRSYAGQPYEQLLLYAYKTLNYLALGEINSARVEVLQADVKMRQWTAAAEWQGIDASVFMRYLSGIVFELTEEWSDALIAYRQAFEILQKNNLQAPVYLQQDLLRLTQRLGLTDEYRRYREFFPAAADFDIKKVQEQCEVILIFHQGLVSRLYEQSITNFSPHIHQHIRIAVPVYPFTTPPISHAQLRIADQSQTTDILQNVDQLARNNIELRTPGIIARAMVRVVAKKAAAKSAGEQDAFAGLLVDLTGILVEQADTRSWTSLPATIQIARVRVPAGEYRVQVITGGTENIGSDFKFERMISLAPKQKTVLSVHEFAI
jgi:hypothetical protein